MKLRISKKVLKQLPVEIAEQIEALGKNYNVKSFTLQNVAPGYKQYHSEGSKYTYIHGKNTMRVDMVSESTIGASNVHYEIGAEVALPVGTTVIEVWYYQTFGMAVTNVGGTFALNSGV